MTKKKKIILIAIAVLLLLIIGIIVFLMVKPDDKKEKDNETTAEINTNSDASTEITDDSSTEDDKTTEDDKKTTEDDAKTTEENEIVKPGSTESAGNNNQNPTTQSPTTQTPSTQTPTTQSPSTQTPQTTQAPTTQQPTTQAPTTQAPGPCSHTWVDDYVEHVSDKVPTYTTEYHDVCNQCGAILDGGLAADHMDAVNCWSYTNNAGFDVQTGYICAEFDWVKTQKCSKCGETKDVSGQYIRYNFREWHEPL